MARFSSLTRGLSTDHSKKSGVGQLPASAVTNISPSAVKSRNGRFAMRDYVSVGDYLTAGGGVGASNDTADLQAAITATPSGGTLVIPQGFYQINAALAIAKPITILGSGIGTPGSNSGAQIVQFTDGADCFTINADYVSISDLVARPTGFTPTAGAGIHQVTGINTHIKGCNIGGFFNNVVVEQGQDCKIDGNTLTAPINWNVVMRNNIGAGDAGDSQMIGNTLVGGGTTALAGLRYESSGGLRFVGNKIVQHKRAIDLQVPDGVATSNFFVQACSIEAQTLNCIRISRSGTTGVFNHHLITGSQFYGNSLSGSVDVIQVGPGISNAVICGNYIEGTANTTAIHSQTGAAGVHVAGNFINVHSVGIQMDGSANGHSGNAFNSCGTNIAGAGTLMTIA